MTNKINKRDVITEGKGIYRCGFLTPDGKAEYEMYIPDPRQDKIYRQEEIPTLMFGFLIKQGKPILIAWDEPESKAEKTNEKEEVGTYTEESFKNCGGVLLKCRFNKIKLLVKSTDFFPCNDPWREIIKGIKTNELYILDRRGFWIN